MSFCSRTNPLNEVGKRGTVRVPIKSEKKILVYTESIVKLTLTSTVKSVLLFLKENFFLSFLKN